MKALVVDDEEDIRGLVKAILTGNGFEVFTSSSGEEALVVADRCRPDLVVLDLVLPRLSGLEVCRLLKGRASTGGVAVVMMSVLNREVDRRLASEAGADGYVSKPFTVAGFLGEVDKAMCGRGVEAAAASG
ncbi:TPA: response regulator [Candidatus Bathyarchaeota archaeon]|nr:response regulator [Candidatus Bathyarchaeota archaeon]